MSFVGTTLYKPIFEGIIPLPIQMLHLSCVYIYIGSLCVRVSALYNGILFII